VESTRRRTRRSSRGPQSIADTTCPSLRTRQVRRLGQVVFRRRSPARSGMLTAAGAPA
jgi:hypothetical protein